MTVQSPPPEPVPPTVTTPVPIPGEGSAFVPKEATSRRVVRNVAATLATQLISWALTFAVTLYLPRYVGDAGLGKLTFAASFMTLFGVVVPLGTGMLLVKEIARDRSRTGELLLAALFLRVPLAFLMTGLAVLAVTLLGYPDLTRTLVTVAAIGMIVGTVNDAFGAALQGQENLTWQSVSTLVNKFLASALTIFLILRHAPLWTLASIGIWTGLASLLVSGSAFRSLLPTLRLPSFTTLRQLASAGLPFMGYAIFQTLYGSTDPIILKFVADDKTVGWYAAGFRLVGTTLFLPNALTTALLPTLSRLYRENTSDFRLLAQRMLMLIMLCSVPITLILVLLPDQLIALMHYPASFAHSIPVLRIGGLGVLLWFAGCSLGTIIIASDGQGRLFYASVAATALGIPACFLGAYLTLRFFHNGAVGAIASDVLLEAYLIGYYIRMLPTGILNAGIVNGLVRCLLASVPTAVLFLFSPLLGWGLWVLLPGLLVYAAACLALGCLSLQDLALIRQTFARKLG